MSSQRNWTKYRVKETSRDTVKDLFYRIKMEEIGKSSESISLPKLLGVDTGTLRSFQNEKGISENAFQEIARSIRNFRPDFEISEHVEPFDTNAARDPLDTPTPGTSTSISPDQSESSVDLGLRQLSYPHTSKLLIATAIAVAIFSLGYLATRYRPSSKLRADTQEAKRSSPTLESPLAVVTQGAKSETRPIQITEKPLPYLWKQQEPELDIDWDIRVARGDEIKSLHEFEEPLIKGDLLKIKLYSKLPVCFNLFWLDSEGAVFRIYPESSSQNGLNTTLELPTTPDQSFVLSGVAGLHALVAVALQVDISLDAMPMPLPQPTNIIPFEQGAAFFDESGMVDRGQRGPPIAMDRTAKVNDPVGVLSTLTKTKWDQRAAAVRAVCFVTTDRSERE